MTKLNMFSSLFRFLVTLGFRVVLTKHELVSSCAYIHGVISSSERLRLARTIFHITFTISQLCATLGAMLPQILAGDPMLQAHCGGRVWFYFGETRLDNVDDEAYKFLTNKDSRIPILSNATPDGRLSALSKEKVKSALHMHAVPLRKYHAHEMVRQVETIVQQFCRDYEGTRVEGCSIPTLPPPNPFGYEVRWMWRRHGAGTNSEMQGNFDLHKGPVSRRSHSYKCLVFWEQAVNIGVNMYPCTKVGV